MRPRECSFLKISGFAEVLCARCELKLDFYSLACRTFARLFVYLPQMKNFVSLCKGSLLALLLIFSALIIVGAQNAPTNMLCASKSEKGKFTGYICDNGIEKIAKQGKFSCLAQ